MLERIRNLRQAVGAATAVAALLAACASTTLRSTWVDPSFTGGPFKKVFVMALSARNVTGRRVFEDVMVGKLQSAGTQAVPAYQLVQGAEVADEPALQAAVAQSGADALLMSRLLGIETQVTTTTIDDPRMHAGWYGAYYDWYSVPEVTRVAKVETSLYDVASKRLVWTAVSDTVNPSTVKEEAPGLADAVIKDLRTRGLLASAR